MKKLLSVLTVILIMALVCGCSNDATDSYPEPTEKFFVNDFADVIEQKDEDEIYSRAVALNEKTTSQVAVITVESLDGKEPAEYALEIANKWGVGNSNDDNGIVILFSEKDREIYIAVGYGLEGALPDSKTGRIIDRYGLEYLKNDEFSIGLLSISKAIINEVYIEYNLIPEEAYTPIDQLPLETTSYSGEKKVIVSWIILFVLITIFSAFFRKFGRNGRFGPLIFFMGNNGNHSNHGGGFFGGSGGGFGGGGFSGGGGGFGGGGAGRGF